MNDSLIHTGRELELMLSGQKSLAMFYAMAHELPWEALIPEEAFAPHVNAGRTLRQDIEFASTSLAGEAMAIKYVFYALPGEEWRTQLMIVLKRAFHSGRGWNETCERMEGTLLGYTNEENDIHCARAFKRSEPDEQG